MRRAARRFCPVYAVTATGDPDFASVSLLVPMDGNFGFVDKGPIGHTVNLVSTPTIDTAQSKFGGSSGKFVAASAQSINVADHASLRLDTGDFTIEGWFFHTSGPGTQVLISKGTGGGFEPWQIWVGPGNNLGFRGHTPSLTPAYSIAGSTTLTTGVWYFYRGTRSGNTFTLELNGTVEGTATFSGTLFSDTNPVQICTYGGAVVPLNGFATNVRITAGVVRSGLPSAAFPVF